MKIKILQENLIKPLSIVNRIVPNNPALPILSNILLEAKNNNLNLQATNLDISLNLQINAEIKEQGKVTVPARSFLEFVSSLSPQALTISEKEGKVSIKGETVQASFAAMNADEFPKFPEKDNKTKFNLKKDLLSEMIKKTCFAAAVDESRPVLTGVLLKTDNDFLKMAATDGFRLSEISVLQKDTKMQLESLIIPSKGLVEAERLLAETSDKQEEITLGKTLDKNQIFFEIGEPINGLLFTRLLEAEYPDYKKIIPDSFSLTVKVNTQELISAVKTASIFARTNGQTLCLFFDHSKKEIIISAKAADLGEGLAKVSAQIDGKGIEVGFNAKFLLDGVSSMGTSETQVKIKEEVAPAMFTPIGNENYCHVVMPVRLQK